MSCQNFEPTINDLARGRMMEAALRESALAHAEDCARCGARLADERMLHSSLRAYASSSETMEAPAPIETALRAAFRQRTTSVEPASVVAIAPTRARHWLHWATAAAAAIVTVFALQVFSLRESPAPLIRASNSGSLPALAQLTVSPAKVFAPDGGVKEIITLPASETRGPAVSKNFNSQYVIASNTSPRRTRAARSNQADAEVVTDFMPLTYGAAMSPNDGGQLVRVELPRSALVSMGLPMNVERLDERVKADVLLGHDGLARAIRFVR